jgi:hypothetical protein
MQQKIRTIHVFFEEEELPLIDATPAPEPEHTRHKTFGLCCLLFLSLLCLGVPILATLLPQAHANTYDTTLTKTLTLGLSLHPTRSQIQISILSTIKETEQTTVTATGSMHQDATKATGLITFYNGLFTSQSVPAGTKLTGKDGVPVITSQEAIIPGATATTPPTYGTVSVTASSAIAGTIGNIATSDIDSACCGASILAQNLYAFSGGQDEKDLPVLTKTDISTGTQALITRANTASTNQAQEEIKPGYILLPLACLPTLSANHQPGDQAETAILTLKETCTPVIYFSVDIATVSQRFFNIPHGSHLVSFTALVLTSYTTATGGFLTIQAIAYLKQGRPTMQTYHFAGKLKRRSSWHSNKYLLQRLSQDSSKHRCSCSQIPLTWASIPWRYWKIKR